MLKFNRFFAFRPKNFQKCGCSSTTDPPKEKPKMSTELTKKTDVTSAEILRKLPTKEELQWRTPWHQKEGEYYSALRTFYSEENNVDVMKYLQMPINLRPSAVKKWWSKRNEEKEIFMQQYLPERNQMLGNELAAAHFIVHRGGAVKFFGENKWIKANQFQQYSLPKHYDKDMVLQAIDCSDLSLYYEGLMNFRDLQQLEWFSINGCEKLDDWAMDRISCIFAHSLLYLDVRNCPSITHRGLGALYKMRNLKILCIDNKLASNEIEMTCIMLQDVNPHLDIRDD